LAALNAGPPRPYTTIISSEALSQHRSDDWVVVDCRFDLKDESWGRAEYGLGHILGAVYASLNDDLSGDRSGPGGRHPIPSVEALAATFGRLGIGDSTQVIAYDQDAGMYASRLWWSLRYLGHDAAAVLDGGWAKWKREGREATGGDEVRPATIFTAVPRPDMRVGLAQVTDISRGERRLLVDARAPERFEGREETIDKVAGHIPGATNHFCRLNLAGDGTMLPADELKARYTALLDGRAPQEAVMYCGSGVTACHNLLAMEHAGLPGTALYPGSWSEWSSDQARPIETGPSRPPA
jgi:thiosulfate/3-mercaptopyruvate sulfurtransferase